MPSESFSICKRFRCTQTGFIEAPVYSEVFCRKSFCFQGFEKGLRHGVIVTITFAAHALDHFVGFEFFLTAASITVTMLFGSIAGKLLGNDGKASILISSGTAICGGSAIAPVIDASEDQASIALGTVFILNALALFMFPEIGQMLHMTQEQWSAIAIHDTSSVVGAAGTYGSDALRIATTVKLARSLWIIPLAVLVASGTRQNVRQVRIPWFIGLFIAAMLVHSFVPGSAPVSGILSHAGWRSMLQGVLTWVAVALGALFAVLHMF